MPYKYVEPEVIVRVGNVTIYHTYKDGTSRMNYWFTDYKEDCDEDLHGTWFDVRELTAWKRITQRPNGREQDPPEEAQIRWALFEAIMCGEIGSGDV